MKIVITGGAGFIGSHLVEAFHDKAEVKVIDNLSTGSLENIKPFLKKIKFVKGDIRNLPLIKREFKGYDYVLHHAALVEVVPKSLSSGLEAMQVNIDGTLNALMAARKSGIKKFIFASSCAVYGEQKVCIEDKEVWPKSGYASCKLNGEQLCTDFQKYYGLETVILRYFNVYGKRQNMSYGAVIPNFIKAIKNNEQPIIYGRGDQTRDFVYVKDVVRANLLAIKSKEAVGNKINIATGKSISLIELVALMNRIFNKNMKPRFERIRPGEIIKSRANVEKAAQILGFKADYSFEQGIKEMIK